MARKHADEWYDSISRLDPPGYRDEEERRNDYPEELEFEEEHERLQYDRDYFRTRLRH
jgi:hypothetical protein